MKRSLLSPLCSAFVVPGLGQILNQDFKKGLIILALVLALFLGGAIKLAFMLRSMINQSGPNSFNALSSLWYLIFPFVIIWIYSVFDAFWIGRKLDRAVRGELR
ncbi:MAG: hypothetical protein P8175_07655 [Deltaproteobacteria bacterium]